MYQSDAWRAFTEVARRIVAEEAEGTRQALRPGAIDKEDTELTQREAVRQHLIAAMKRQQEKSDAQALARGAAKGQPGAEQLPRENNTGAQAVVPMAPDEQLEKWLIDFIMLDPYVFFSFDTEGGEPFSGANS